MSAAILSTACATAWGCNLIAGIDSPELVVDASGAPEEGAVSSEGASSGTPSSEASTLDQTQLDSPLADQTQPGDSSMPDAAGDGDATITEADVAVDASLDADAFVPDADDGAASDTSAVDQGTDADAGASADAPIADAVADADGGGPTTLQCAWVAPNPTLLVDLSKTAPASPSFQSDPNVHFRSNSDNNAWIAMQLNGDSTGFNLYGFDTQRFTVSNYRQAFQGGSGFINAIIPTSGGMAILSPQYGMSSSVPLDVYDIPGQYNGQTLAPYSIGQLPNPQNMRVGFFEMATGDYFYYASYGSGTAYPLVVGRGTQTGGPGVQSTIATATTQWNSNAELVHGAPNMYLLPEGNPGPQGAAQVYVVPDTAQVTGSVMPTTVTGPGITPLLLGSTQDPSVGGNADLLFAQINTDAGLSLDLYIGDVAKTSLGQLVVQSPAFVTGPTFNAATAPVGGMTWFTDQLTSTEYLAMIGTPLAGSGMNFYWMDLTGRILASAAGPNRLIAGDSAIEKMAIVSTGAIGGVEAKFIITWTEQQFGDAGRYEQLYINELDCH